MFVWEGMDIQLSHHLYWNVYLLTHHWSAVPPLRYVKSYAFLDLFFKFCSTGLDNYSSINTQSYLLQLDSWGGKFVHFVVAQEYIISFWLTPFLHKFKNHLNLTSPTKIIGILIAIILDLGRVTSFIISSPLIYVCTFLSPLG